MAHEHGHSHARRSWGEPPLSPLRRLVARARALVTAEPRRPDRGGLKELPAALRRSPHAPAYLAAERDDDHARAGEVAASASAHAVEAGEWWPADAWAHRALWHFEQAQLTLDAARQARRIGDLRTAAGDAASARRYYAEAIDEARDIGAEREQGLAAFGLGRALLDLGEVTQARRLASAAVDLLERADAPRAELDAARHLLGRQVVVGAALEDRGDRMEPS